MGILAIQRARFNLVFILGDAGDSGGFEGKFIKQAEHPQKFIIPALSPLSKTN